MPSFRITSLIAAVCICGVTTAIFSESPEITRDEYLRSKGLERERQSLIDAQETRAEFAGIEILVPVISKMDSLGRDILAELDHNRRMIAFGEYLADVERVGEDFANAATQVAEGNFASAVLIYRDMAQEKPDDLQIQALFLNSCYLAGDDCPALFPQWRSRMDVFSCDDAIIRAQALMDLTMNWSFHSFLFDLRFPMLAGDNLYETEFAAWVVSAAAHTGGMIVLQKMPDGGFERAALGIIIFDRLMECNKDTETAVYYRLGIGEPGKTHHDLMRPVMYGNLLDVAWRVLDYELPEEGGTNED